MDNVQARQFQQASNVSRETYEQYVNWENLLTRWNKKINLVSLSTVNNFWLRHALDSQQLIQFIPDNALSCLDLGSGAGFPGLAIAIGLKDRKGAHVTLVESNGKKCNFLRTVIRELSLPAKPVQDRVEKIESEKFDVISARAFAPLSKLLDYALPFWGADSLGLFPKGTNWQAEVDQAMVDWSFDVDAVQSETDTEARILLVRNLKRKSAGDQAGEK